MNQKQFVVAKILATYVFIHFWCLAQCPSPFIAHPDNGLCYGYFEDRNDFFAAELHCRSYGEGGMLAKVDSMDLVTWLIASVLVNHTTGAVWFGINDIEENAVYKYNDGSPVKFQHWSTKFHGDVLKQECIRGSVPTFVLSDAKCSNLLSSVCQLATNATQDMITEGRFRNVASLASPLWAVMGETKSWSNSACVSACMQSPPCAVVYVVEQGLYDDCVLLKADAGPFTVPAGARIYRWIVQ